MKRILTLLVVVTLISNASADQGYYNWRFVNWFAGDYPNGFGAIDFSDSLPHGHRITCSYFGSTGGVELRTGQTDELLSEEYLSLGFNSDSQFVPHFEMRAYGEPFNGLGAAVSLSLTKTNDLYVLLFDVDEHDAIVFQSDISNDLWEVVGSGDLTAGGGAAPGPTVTLGENGRDIEILSPQSLDSNSNFIALKPNAPITLVSLELESEIPPESDFRMGLFLLENRSADFNNDHEYNCTDLDRLIVNITEGGFEDMFDLNDDGLLDANDIDAWLEEAGYATIGRPYLMGDANLDGFVDVSDFNIWNEHKFTTENSWCSGDFSADGAVDVADFNLWNENKFRPTLLANVPEPQMVGFMLVFAAL
ncbi:MAG: hypothetical protein AAF497_25405, partial [Planctomycetota bacterium]